MDNLIEIINQKIKDIKKALDNSRISIERHYFQGQIDALKGLKSTIRQSTHTCPICQSELRCSKCDDEDKLGDHK